ncbi:YihY/virulence factor BrkB family protein [Clostridiales bacterium BAD-6]|uniref:YihY/virulence factor BrkB family protein n=2 Tax=Sinanaerobacter chloroacetimidivorans TaxID=2818044 RepID=A0A8J7VYI7_9FIRM|nr:YihY/virulence factor BrkB family protein [Sinanaerobacter chloroacetimidivorans]
MSRKRFRRMIFMIIKRMSEPYYQGVAAELAFFFLMSLVPIAIILGELLGVFSISMSVIHELLSEYVSPEIAKSLSTYLSYTPSGTISVLFILFSLWAASKAQFSMMRISNYSFTGHPSGRGYFRERFRAIKTIVFTLFTLVFSLLILVYGELIIKVFSAYVTDFLGLTFSFDEAWYLLRWPFAMALYFFMVSYNYYVLPTERIPFKKILPGSILASGGMLLATWIYSYYASVFANYDLLYGSLAAIVALLFWFYILGYILVIGIQVNVVWDQAK